MMEIYIIKKLKTNSFFKLLLLFIFSMWKLTLCESCATHFTLTWAFALTRMILKCTLVCLVYHSDVANLILKILKIFENP